MAAIKEDYCSKEIYRLLIKKGFDGEVHTSFDEEGYTQPSISIQMAMKWLRKEHNLCIVSLPVVTDDEGEGGCLWKYTISMKLKVLFDSGNLYESPEIALDDAIKRCCENLI